MNNEFQILQWFWCPPTCRFYVFRATSLVIKPRPLLTLLSSHSILFGFSVLRLSLGTVLVFLFLFFSLCATHVIMLLFLIFYACFHHFQNPFLSLFFFLLLDFLAFLVGENFGHQNDLIFAGSKLSFYAGFSGSVIPFSKVFSCFNRRCCVH